MTFTCQKCLYPQGNPDEHGAVQQGGEVYEEESYYELLQHYESEHPEELDGTVEEDVREAIDDAEEWLDAFYTPIAEIEQLEERIDEGDGVVPFYSDFRAGEQLDKGANAIARVRYEIQSAIEREREMLNGGNDE